jgi:hypothetical protein
MTAKIIRCSRALTPAALMLLLATLAGAADTPPGVDAKADEAMRKMSAFLAAAKRFSFTAEETYDLEMARAYRIEVTNNRTLTVERPSRFAAVGSGDTLQRSSWYDGRTLTVLNRQKNAYTALEMPGTIDGVLDKLAEDYEIVLPLSDLLYADPYASLMGGVLYGKYLGIHTAEGVPCHHLTFGQEGLYWQIWIDAGPKPLPRKLSLVYWELPGAPRYEATFKSWNLGPTPAAALFQFKPPAGARKVEPAELARMALAPQE